MPSEERIEGKRRQKRIVRGIACSVAAVPLSCLFVFVLLSKSLSNVKTSARQFHPSLRSLRIAESVEKQDNTTSFLEELSNDFPLLDDSMEMARLSGLVYRFRLSDDCNATSSHGTPLLPEDLTCHLYNHDRSQGTQVMILSSRSKQYIAVVYAGTDDLRTTLTDTDILMKPFGPLDEHGESILLPGDARVHAGFDNAVFQHDLYETVLNITQHLLKQQPRYRLFTTGHSLGGANAILTAVALTLQELPVDKITCISFGCPNIGNEAWRNAVHALSPVNSTQIAIWRFVHGWDVVPRLPQYPFTHVGHTLQMNVDGMRAYYLHRGNASLNYASVPLGWSGE